MLRAEEWARSVHRAPRRCSDGEGGPRPGAGRLRGPGSEVGEQMPHQCLIRESTAPAKDAGSERVGTHACRRDGQAASSAESVVQVNQNGDVISMCVQGAASDRVPASLCISRRSRKPRGVHKAMFHDLQLLVCRVGAA